MNLLCTSGFYQEPLETYWILMNILWGRRHDPQTVQLEGIIELSICLEASCLRREVNP